MYYLQSLARVSRRNIPRKFVLSGSSPATRRSLAVSRAYSAAAGEINTQDGQELEHQPFDASAREGWLFIDSMFPVTMWKWDLRQYLGKLREEAVFDELSSVLSKVKAHNFHVVSIEPQLKDGGVFVKFQYSAGHPESALDTILEELRLTANAHGGMPSWWGVHTGNAWLVKGKPWKEDMNRYASPVVKVAFDGPDVKEEALYELLRPYGRIIDITPPQPVPASVLRSAVVSFRHVRSAAIARNTIHGLAIPSDTGGITRLRTSYQMPIEAHAIRDYITSHPRIFLPILFFVLGSLTYTVFDPIRVLMVEGKLNDWFDHRQYKAYKWVKSTMLDRFSLAEASSHAESTLPAVPGVWKERQDAEAALTSYLSDVPNTVAFLFGPQGSGKSHMIQSISKEKHRKALVIDIAQLSKASSDAALMSGLANQTGYWPVFSFLNSMNNLIDLASVGLIGQKAGLSSSLTDQLKQILEVVGTGLRSVNADRRKQRQKQLEEEHAAQLRAADEARLRERIIEGTWHDPRLDCIAGNGIMSELGVGDELFGDIDSELKASSDEKAGEKQEGDNWHWNLTWNRNGESDVSKKVKPANTEELRAIEAMPIVVIKNFDSKGGGSRKAELLNVISQWAASLADGGVAHVIVVSTNRENVKQFAKALPSKPINIIALSDADSASALSLVKQKLHDANVEVDFGREETSHIERLGGRAEDLESLVHKVRSGMSVQQAVEDIIQRGIGELRKVAFGDDNEDAKNLPWQREQAWFLMKQLAKRGEIAYYEALIDFPFKGDETPLRELEHAELISIATHQGRPAFIRPGKPIYKYVFERLVDDPTFRATQNIAFNQRVIAANEGVVKACEDELVTLKEVEAGTSHWWGSRRAVNQRGEYLLKKMKAAGEKIEALEKQNSSLKKVLSKGG